MFQCPLGLELLRRLRRFLVRTTMFQCPLGLELLRGYSSQHVVSDGVNALSGLSCYKLKAYEETGLSPFQCPLGLELLHAHLSRLLFVHESFNALSGLYLISTLPLQKPRFYAVSRVCFCRYLSEYSDNSRFSCMLTFWTYLMRCTYPRHWIKYSTNYNRCHPIFSLS